MDTSGTIFIAVEDRTGRTELEEQNGKNRTGRAELK